MTFTQDADSPHKQIENPQSRIPPQNADSHGRSALTMNYGPLFLISSIALAASAIFRGGWYWLSLWPAVSLAVIAGGYFGLGVKVFGKTPRGLFAPLHFAVLLPYLATAWLVWNLVRPLRRELAYHSLSEKILLGRRLLSHELPNDVQNVVDLTCEFIEPRALRRTNYLSFPVLDASVPSEADLRRWIDLVANLEGKTYIHCAEGRGRTGMFTVALLLQSGEADTVEAAIATVTSHRPQIRLTGKQREFLHDVYGK